MHSSLASVGEKLTVTTSVVMLDPAKYLHANWAELDVQGGPVRYHQDGRIPTNGDGKIRYDGGIITLVSLHEIREFRAIRDSSAVADATLEVSYRK